ncbi:MAG: RNA polymerase sigma-70 factor [Parabacteroides sp.]
MIDDKQLILRLKSDDREAFSLLYQRYWAKVHRFCQLYLTDRSLAEDVVQEVFIKIWESRAFLHEEDHFEGLLFIITRNFIFNQHRKSVNEEFYELTVIAAMESEEDVEAEISARNLQQFIDTLIKELPERRRLIFNMSRKEHKSYKEIAQALQLSEKTVENQINAALKFLRKNLLLLLYFV